MQELSADDIFAKEYLDFLDASPSPYHAIQNAAQRLESSGFKKLSRTEPWPGEAGKFFFTEQGAQFAWISPGNDAITESNSSFAIVGAHSDSPSLKLKPTPQRTTPDGWGELMVEIYGGPLYNSWLDRELLIAGQLVDKDGNNHLVRTAPLARVCQLAPHLDRSVNAEGVKLNAQQHMQPIWTVDDPEAQVLDLVAKEAGLSGQDQISGFDLFLYPSERGERFGPEKQFLAAARQDNLSSTFAGLRALSLLDPSDLSGSSRIPVFVVFDHEEVGSGTATGARGPLLRSSLHRIASNAELNEEGFERMIARSSVISADASHSVHPNYPAKHDPDTRPVMGRGPVLKLDADQSYATSAPGSAMWERACSRAGIQTQYFVSESSMRSGSTIGPAMSIALGVTTVDVGIPILSMHSAREMSHVRDTPALANALASYWTA